MNSHLRANINSNLKKNFFPTVTLEWFRLICCSLYSVSFVSSRLQWQNDHSVDGIASRMRNHTIAQAIVVRCYGEFDTDAYAIQNIVTVRFVITLGFELYRNWIRISKLCEAQICASRLMKVSIDIYKRQETVHKSTETIFWLTERDSNFESHRKNDSDMLRLRLFWRSAIKKLTRRETYCEHGNNEQLDIHSVDEWWCVMVAAESPARN